MGGASPSWAGSTVTAKSCREANRCTVGRLLLRYPALQGKDMAVVPGLLGRGDTSSPIVGRIQVILQPLTPTRQLSRDASTIVPVLPRWPRGGPSSSDRGRASSAIGLKGNSAGGLIRQEDHIGELVVGGRDVPRMSSSGSCDVRYNGMT